MRVLILGRTGALHATARHLLEATEHEIAAVPTARAAPEYGRAEEDFRALAAGCGAPFLLTQRLGEEVVALVRRSGAEIAVSVNWVSVIGEGFLGLLPRGVLNAHLGDLPRYRGNAVANWAILRHEPEVVLTVHQMSPGLDEGDVVLQRPLPLTPETTIAEVSALFEQALPGLFADTLDGLPSGRLRPVPQSPGGFRCHPRLPQDGRIDWAAPARHVDALVRSLVKPYSGAFTYQRFGDEPLEKLHVWRTRIVAEQTSDVGVPGHVIRNDRASGESWILTGGGVVALCEVSHGEDGPVFAPGRRWRSTRIRLGMDLEAEIHRLQLPSGT